MTSTVRTAAITGAAQGIGEAVARRLADEGYERLVLIDRQKKKLDEVAQDLRKKGTKVHTVELDLADAEAIRGTLKSALGEDAELHVLVNAAGTTARGGLSDTKVETFDRIFAINVRAPFFMMQEAAELMPRGGVIVNICSMLAYGGPPFLLAYSSSKAGLAALTKGAANSLKWKGIRVFAINLGWTWTPAEQIVQTEVHGLPENWREEVGSKQPFGRLLMPEDPASLIAFLASDGAAMMTGAVIDLDQHVAGTVDDNPGNQ